MSNEIDYSRGGDGPNLGPQAVDQVGRITFAPPPAHHAHPGVNLLNAAPHLATLDLSNLDMWPMVGNPVPVRDGMMSWAKNPDDIAAAQAEQQAADQAAREQAEQAAAHEAHRCEMEASRLSALRDQFAGQVLAQVVTHKTIDQMEQEPLARFARLAYDLADAMLIERARRQADEQA